MPQVKTLLDYFRKSSLGDKRSNYGGGSFGGGGARGSWEETETPAKVKERKVSVVVPTVTTVNNEKISSNKSTNPTQKALKPRSKVIESITLPNTMVYAKMPKRIGAQIPIPPINTPETIQVPQTPIHYTRKMVRDYLRAKGEHPYDYGALNRRALRHYLNGDKPIKQKYYRKIQDTVAAPYKDNNIPVTTLTDLGDIFLKRND